MEVTRAEVDVEVRARLPTALKLDTSRSNCGMPHWLAALSPEPSSDSVAQELVFLKP